MPQYELMYLLGSHVGDDQVPGITEQVKKFVEEAGGSDIRETHLGKKKLAYPIKKTRNGYYVVVDFLMQPQGVAQLDARVRSQDTNIIRYIIVNLDEHFARLEKDKVAQAKLTRRPQNGEISSATSIPAEKSFAEKIEKKEKPAGSQQVPAPALEDIDSEALDKKIEEALSEDLTK